MESFGDKLKMNFKPPNPCYLISAATFLYSCVLGIVWSTWKPLCSKNYIGMSPLYELWVKALFSCRADPLFCWQKNTVRTDSLKIVFVIFSSCPNSQSFKCHFLHLPYCTLALCTFTVSDDDILVVSSLIYINASKLCASYWAENYKLWILNIYLHLPFLILADTRKQRLENEPTWYGLAPSYTPLTNQWRLFNGFPHYSSILESIKSPLDQPSLCPPAKSEWNCRVTCPSTSWTDSVALESSWIFFRVISYWTQDSDSSGVGYVQYRPVNCSLH